MDVPGVVSVGLNTVLDERTRLYKKYIEVEFTTGEAQSALLAMQSKGSIVINQNTFHLQDYLQLLYTEKLRVMPTNSRPRQIIDANPKCYAHNVESPEALGSFCIVTDSGEYLAISNLHVLAEPREFKEIGRNENYVLQNTDVQLMIGGKPHAARIADGGYKIGNEGIYGYDYCICKTDKAAFDAYQQTIDLLEITPTDDREMRMFGAFSKYVRLYPHRKPTLCSVEYNGFTKELLLFKIATSSIRNISEGDSGSFVYYRIGEQTGSILLKGLLVAKSDNFAYMTKFPKYKNILI